MSKPIYEIADELPKNNITIMALKSLDFIIPGEWDNIVGFENMIKTYTGETDEDMIQQIGDRAIWLYNDKNEGYQNALWLYQTVDNLDTALAAGALANKVTEKIPLFGFFNRITPNADKAQAIDLAIKLVVEIVAYCKINGIPGDSIGDFVGSLTEEYSGDSLMRMVALICIDGLLPLGPDFIGKVSEIINNLSPSELEQNSTFKDIQNSIPGSNSSSKLGFIGESFSAVQGWMGDFINDHNLTPDTVFNRMQGFVEFSDDKLDYVAAFLDMTTNYFEHTGTQTLLRSLIERAYGEI